MRFAGYAAVFDRADRGGDVVRGGAFARSLKRQGGAVPLLWQHEAGRPIGRIEYLKRRSDDALVGGANLALLGDELIQFGEAVPLGEGRFRLSRLLRGRMGTEWASTGHLAGEPFVRIERHDLAAIEPPLAMLGGEVRLMATGLGDDVPATASRLLTGEAARPPSPAHFRAEWLADGNLALAWVRRSRDGWAWLDGSDAPLVEENEAYRLILSSGSFERVVTVTQPGFVYSAAAQTEDGAAWPITASVSQLGTMAPSRAAEILVPPQS